jgi:beta-galactosidase/beta-glucuronidase
MQWVLAVMLLAACQSRATAAAVAAPANPVYTVATPIPLPGDSPMPPDQLRAKNVNTLELTGVWRFAVTRGQMNEGGTFQPGTVWDHNPNIIAPNAVADFFKPDFHDSNWAKLKVPSNWEIEGFSVPTYNDADPTVGLYRRIVAVPKTFAGKRILWRFDGALSGTEIFVNGNRVGCHQGGYCAFDVDVTDFIKPGQDNLLALRLCKLTPTTDFDTGDYECLGGVYRETYLIALPQTHLSDLTVRTYLDKNYVNAQLRVDATVKGSPGTAITLQGQLLQTDGTPVSNVTLSGSGTIDQNGQAAIAMQASVAAPKLWSAEKPNLYFVVLRLSGLGGTGETVEQRFGFRQVELRDGVLLWNGVPIKLAGTCRHEIYPTLGAALTDDIWLKDIAAMKGANVNAIRTSHYNHATRFLDLCDENGFYILDEVPACWIHEFIHNKTGGPALKQRVAETIARDKNRPCVLAWSIGNENGMGPNLQIAYDYAKQLDPTRPAFVSQQSGKNVKGQKIADGHYPWPSEMISFPLREPKTPVNYTEQPHIFWKTDAKQSDSAVADLWGEALYHSWETIYRSPTNMGSFIWEWQGQGIADKYRAVDHSYTDSLRFENNKGVVDSFHHPKPEWWYVRAIYSPVQVNTHPIDFSNGGGRVAIENRYSFTNFNELNCHWTALKQGQPIGNGDLHIDCAPRTQAMVTIPAVPGVEAVRIEVDSRDDRVINSVIVPVAGIAPPPAPTAQSAGSPLDIGGNEDMLVVQNDRCQFMFDRATAQLQKWSCDGRDLIVGGPMLNCGNLYWMTNDPRHEEEDADRLLDWSQSPSFAASRLLQGQSGDDVWVTTTGTVRADRAPRSLGELRIVYDINRAGSAKIRWTLFWDADPCIATELGVKFLVPKDLGQMSWFRTPLLTDLPNDHVGVGTGSCTADDISFLGAKRNLHWMALTDKNGAGLVACGDGAPLIGRGRIADIGSELLLSTELGISQDFSESAVAQHRTNLMREGQYSGSFILHATAAPK